MDREMKVMEYNEETERFHPRKKLKEHYSVTVEPVGRYADHFVPEEATSKETHAKQIALYLVKWLNEHDAEDTIVALGGDSTNTNTRWKKGVNGLVEELLGRPLIWLICSLHTNEQPLRKLIEELMVQPPVVLA